MSKSEKFFLVPLGSGSKWEDNELKYMIRSLEKYAGEYSVKLYCEYVPGFLDKDKISYKIIKRYYPEKAYNYHKGNKMYENFFDTLNKLYTACMDDNIPEDFYYIYDDICLLKDPGNLMDKSICIGKEEDKMFSNRGKTKWGRTINQAVIILKAHGKPTYFYETHLVRKYNKKKLKYILDFVKWNDLLIPPAVSTFYYNWYNEKPFIDLKDGNYIKAGFYRESTTYPGSYKSSTYEDVVSSCKDKVFINYNNMGFNAHIKRFLEEKFPDKSKYEL